MIPTKPTGGIDFRDLQEFDGKFNYADGKSTMRLASHQNFSPIGRLDHKISTFISRAFLVVDLKISCVRCSQ